MPTIKFTIEDENGDETQLLMPATWDVCPQCEGEGRIPDPALSPSGEGFYTATEFHEAYDTPEEREAYFSGRYDRACPSCNGRTTIPVPDYDSADPDIAEQFREMRKREAYYAAERAAERRMGY